MRHMNDSSWCTDASMNAPSRLQTPDKCSPAPVFSLLPYFPPETQVHVAEAVFCSTSITEYSVASPFVDSYDVYESEGIAF